MEIKRSRIEKSSVILKISRPFDSYIQKQFIWRWQLLEFAIFQAIMFKVQIYFKKKIILYEENA